MAVLESFSTENGSTLSSFKATSGRIFDKVKVNNVDVIAHKGNAFKQTRVELHNVVSIEQETEHFKATDDLHAFSVKRFILTTTDGERVELTAYKAPQEAK